MVIPSIIVSALFAWNVGVAEDGSGGFRSMTLPLGSGLEYSVCVG